jgi:5-methylcytosine-specific restriction protein A
VLSGTGRIERLEQDSALVRDELAAWEIPVVMPTPADQDGEHLYDHGHSHCDGGRSMTDTGLAAAVFRRELERQLANAQAAGLSHVRITAGALHRQVGGYPGKDHRMPICCDVMRAQMRPGDRVVATPPRGLGASLTIEYRLPRL